MQEFPERIKDSSGFLVFWGYVLVDFASLTGDDWIIYDSCTTPEEIQEKMKEENVYIFIRKHDEAMQWRTIEEYKELCKLHNRILEEREKAKKSRKTRDYIVDVEPERE